MATDFDRLSEATYQGVTFPVSDAPCEGGNDFAEHTAYRRARLRFEAVDYFAEVWINGEWVGEHEGNFAPRTGAVLSGPPPRPLGRIDVEVRDGAIWALGYRP